MTDSLPPIPDPPAPAARLGDGGDYYLPGLAVREPGLVLATWFFLATEEEVPEIRARLRSDVYERLPEGRRNLHLWRDEYDRWSLHEDDWEPPSRVFSPLASSWNPQAMIEGVLALRAWARRFRLTSHPLIEAAVLTLTGWEDEEIAEKHGRPAPSPSAWSGDFDFIVCGFESLSEQERLSFQEIIRSTEVRDPLGALRIDLCDRWDPRFETRRAFARRITDDLARQLQRYLARSERHLQARGFQKVPRKAARHHLSWLVQHRLRGLSYEEIADRYAAENPELDNPPTRGAVGKAVRRTAAMLELI